MGKDKEDSDLMARLQEANKRIMPGIVLSEEELERIAKSIEISLATDGKERDGKPR